MCMLYEASLPYSQSCKGTWVYYRVKNLHLYSIKTIGVMDYKTKKHKRFNFISFLTFSNLELNITLKKSTLEISGVIPVSNRNETS